MIRRSQFKPAWWLKSRHFQTLWPTFFRRKLKLKTKRERLELADGDFIDLNWIGKEGAPIVLVLHGLCGSLESPYAQGIMHKIREQGWHGVLMHFRGCSGEPNRLARCYHSGETGDLSAIIDIIHKRYPRTPLVAVGYSLGGNVLLKWLGETQHNNPLSAAVAVSVPFELNISASVVNQGISRIYQWGLLRDLRKMIEKKFKHMPVPPISLDNLNTLRNFHQFDSHVTAPLHGFKDALDYYQKCSIRQYLKHITVPTLILHALDDPLFVKNIMFEDHELSSHLTLELAECGGHVGFIAGNIPFWPEYWLEKRIPEFFNEILYAGKTAHLPDKDSKEINQINLS